MSVHNPPTKIKQSTPLCRIGKSRRPCLIVGTRQTVRLQLSWLGHSAYVDQQLFTTPVQRNDGVRQIIFSAPRTFSLVYVQTENTACRERESIAAGTISSKTQMPAAMRMMGDRLANSGHGTPTSTRKSHSTRTTEELVRRLLFGADLLVPACRMGPLSTLQRTLSAFSVRNNETSTRANCSNIEWVVSQGLGESQRDAVEPLM